jgi:hypothetical protein
MRSFEAHSRERPKVDPEVRNIGRKFVRPDLTRRVRQRPPVASPGLPFAPPGPPPSARATLWTDSEAGQRRSFCTSPGACAGRGGTLPQHTERKTPSGPRAFAGLSIQLPRRRWRAGRSRPVPNRWPFRYGCGCPSGDALLATPVCRSVLLHESRLMEVSLYLVTTTKSGRQNRPYRRQDAQPRSGLRRSQHDHLVRRYAVAEQDQALCRIILNEVADLDADLKADLKAIAKRASERQWTTLARLGSRPDLRSNAALRSRAGLVAAPPAGV